MCPVWVICSRYIGVMFFGAITFASLLIFPGTTLLHPLRTCFSSACRFSSILHTYSTSTRFPVYDYMYSTCQILQLLHRYFERFAFPPLRSSRSSLLSTSKAESKGIRSQELLCQVIESQFIRTYMTRLTILSSSESKSPFARLTAPSPPYGVGGLIASRHA
jgi:hypothetical protein